MYVAVDLELTGIKIDGELDDYAESAGERVAKLCRIAELHAPIQIGMTLVAESNGKAVLSSYNFLSFPVSGSFVCSASAMRFNSENNKVDLNAWIKEGVPYMTREEESRMHGMNGVNENGVNDTGLLRLWKALCAKKLPLVVHSPQDLFFLLTAFEQKSLPREDPQELANLIFNCFPCVYDTAYLHGSIGGFREMRLTSFLREAKEKHSQLMSSGDCENVEFLLEAQTAARYNDENAAGDSDFHAHEAGYDSLATAQLFALLFKIAPSKVTGSKNCLFLYRSSEYVSLGQAQVSGNPGCNIFDLTVVTPLIVRLDKVEYAKEVMRSIVSAGFEYKRVNDNHLLVIITSAGTSAIEEAAKLSPKVSGVTKWLPLQSYLQEVRRSKPAPENRNRLRNKPVPRPNAASAVEGVCAEAAEAAMSSLVASGGQPSSSSRDDGTGRTSSRPVGSVQGIPPTPQLNVNDTTRYFGKVKSLEASVGYGFIESHATWNIYQRDVFLHKSQWPQITEVGSTVPELGTEVSFTVLQNAKGQPQATDVLPQASSSPDATSAVVAAQQLQQQLAAQAVQEQQTQRMQQAPIQETNHATSPASSLFPAHVLHASQATAINPLAPYWVVPGQMAPMPVPVPYPMMMPQVAPLLSMPANPGQRTLGQLGAAAPSRSNQGEHRSAGGPDRPPPSSGGGQSNGNGTIKKSGRRSGGANTNNRGKHRAGHHETDRTHESTRCNSSDDSGSAASNLAYSFQ
jgi:cold shock CspA family protein